jgi:hypothetical protein
VNCFDQKWVSLKGFHIDFIRFVRVGDNSFEAGRETLTHFRIPEGTEETSRLPFGRAVKMVAQLDVAVQKSVV